jgi:hypothetical protein
VVIFLHSSFLEPWLYTMHWVFDLLRTMVMSPKNLHDTLQRFDVVSDARPTMAYIPSGSLNFCSRCFLLYPAVYQYTSLRTAGPASKIPFVSRS